MVDVRRVTGDDARRLRALRLAALSESPAAFGSTLADEARTPEGEWRRRALVAAEGSSQAIFLARSSDRVVGIVGGYREGDGPVELVSLWVSPECRRSGVASDLVAAVVWWAMESGGASVRLWVTCGNIAAEELYRAVGFSDTGLRQPLPSDRTKEEARLELRLNAPA